MAHGRTQLGPFWLYYRNEREQWFIAWYDDGGHGRSRRTCRKATGISERGDDARPPQAAQDALADHYASWRKPIEQSRDEAFVEGLLADWLERVAQTNSDPIRARDCVVHWLAFFALERAAGTITRGPFVSDITRALCQKYVQWRKMHAGKRRNSTTSGATISRELAALRAALRWAWQNERITSAPFIPDIEAKDKAAPKDLVYSPEQVARILDAAARSSERHHVIRFVLLMMSTHGRSEAVLELHSQQIRDGLIQFNIAGRAQTKKRRSIVPIARTLAPWLSGIDGKVIQYRRGELVRPTMSIKKAFEACLIDAGICHQEVDERGELMWLPQRCGDKAARPKLKGLGSPNTLRHTCATELHALGVPQAQIDAAAGHVGTGTNQRNYRHLRPDYLVEFVAGVEAYWKKVDRYTSVHRDPSVIPKQPCNTPVGCKVVIKPYEISAL